MKRLILLPILLLLVFQPSSAQEGMWLLSQLEQLGLAEKGLEIPVDRIYDEDRPSITDAIVSLGGCTASFVSENGLVLTNHHCAFGALQRNSKEGTDYIRDGFLARSTDEEIQAPGYSVSVLLSMKDVTDEILAAAGNETDQRKRDRLISGKARQMTQKIGEQGPDINANVSVMYNGRQYVLFVFRRYTDVRIVYAPPASIGKYGGDIDNWMWPRHTGDFTFLRAYMAPDGSGRAYDPGNVPVKPKAWLRVAKGDLKDGDFTFIMGFPGRTTRYRTSNSANWNLKYNYPSTIRNFGEIITLIDEFGEKSENARIRLASFRSSLANTMKNYQGKVAGMKKTNFVQRKKQFEKKLMDYVTSDAQLDEKYGDILDKIREQYDILGEYKEFMDAINMFGMSSGTLSSLAIQVYGIARERAKPESERRPGFSEPPAQQTADRLKLTFAGYYEPFDKAMLKRVLSAASQLKGKARIKGLEYLFNGSVSINDFVEDAYNRTGLSDTEMAVEMFSMSLDDLMKADDPLIGIAAALYDEMQEVREKNSAFGSEVTALRKRYIDALYEWKGEGLYPDANGTMRFTSGNVAGYRPADAVLYEPFTRLKGVVEKHTGEEPFDCPEKLVQLHAQKDYGSWKDPELNDVPVAFTHRCDITGGNSGSPVMNARGELIGLAFDGNYEAMISDWQYHEELQRTISVDIRYVMFVTEKLAGATHILREMGIN